MYESDSLSRRPWYTAKKQTGPFESFERSVTAPFLCMLVLSPYAVHTNSLSLGMRLSFVLVVDGFCPAFLRLIESQSGPTTLARSSKVAESVALAGFVIVESLVGSYVFNGTLGLKLPMFFVTSST